MTRVFEFIAACVCLLLMGMGLAAGIFLIVEGVPLPSSVVVLRTNAYYHPVTGDFTWPDKEVVKK